MPWVPPQTASGLHFAGVVIRACSDGMPPMNIAERPLTAISSVEWVRRDDVRFCSIKPMKMMDWPVAMADAETIGGRDRRTDPGLGMTNGGFHRLTPGKARGDGGGQRA